MEHNFIDLTCSESPSGGSSERPLKRSRPKVRTRQSVDSRSQRELSSSSSVVSSQDPSNFLQETLTSLHASNSTSSSDAQPPRFVGDGLDFRRPANYSSGMNSQPTTLIDLTLSDDGDDDEPEAQFNLEDERIDINENEDDEEDGDDIQITGVHSNIRPPAHRQQPPPQHRHARSQRRPLRGPRFPRSIMNDAPDSGEIPISHIRSTRNRMPYGSAIPSHPRTLPPLPTLRPPPPSTAEVIDITGDGDNPARQLPPLSQSHYPPPSGRALPAAPSHMSHALAIWRTVRHHVPSSFLGPHVMDYTRTAFNVATPGANHSPQPASSSPALPPLDPLPPAPDGFTRSPREGDVLICPFCRIELCTGEDAGKSQVWVVKACGHVYCGKCATKRPRSKPKKTKEGLFLNCVVDGCNEKVIGTKAMYQLFL